MKPRALTGYLLLMPALLAVFLPPAQAETTDGLGDYETVIEEWRSARQERLSSDDGWLTLVGLEWLKDGENRVGSAPGSAARMPGGPEKWGTVTVDGDRLTFMPEAGVDIRVDGELAHGVVELVADNQGEPTVISSGKLNFHVIFRESYALRVKDKTAPTLMSFTGVDYYDIRRDWRKEGRLLRAPAGETIEIGNVLGQLEPRSVYGTFEFEQDGADYSLIALGDENSESLWFLFADRTSGRETYGAGRFVYSDGMPENGRLVVDFNKAYNPPCAFNAYSTCPLPPQHNRLELAVTAGEKDYHHD
jgi:uncharacterized protein (DUF1684 family)